MGSDTPSAMECLGLKFKISILLHGEIARGTVSCDHSRSVLLSIAPPPSVSDKKFFVRNRCGGSNRVRGPNACGPTMTESETDDGAEDDSLTLDEVTSGVAGAYLRRAQEARYNCKDVFGGTGLDSGEIVTDAIEAALTTRSCPRHITVMAFLVQTMRSRISNHRKKCRRSIVKTPASSGDFVEARSPASLELFPSAETILVERDESEKKTPDWLSSSKYTMH